MTPEERDHYLRPKPPPVSWPVRACRNLAQCSPLLHRDGIHTELLEDSLSVLVTREDASILLTATDTGWTSIPDLPELRLPLESTVPLERRIHAHLTRSI